MRKKRRTNGYGRCYADVYVIVRKPHDAVLIDAGWVVSSSSSDSTTFGYTCVNRYEGDDETVVHSLWSDLPLEFDREQFKIDWDNSVY